MFKHIVLLTSLLFSGVALSATYDETPVCHANLKQNPYLQGIKNKIALGPTKDQTSQMLADNTVPTQDEMQMIAYWIAERNKCTQLGDAWRTKNFSPAILNIYNTLNYEVMSLASNLYYGQITYGQFAQWRAYKSAEAEKAWRAQQ
jgi:hypothetical protein